MKYIKFLFFVFSLPITAQDPVYTNTHQSLVALNPSFAGSNGLFRFQHTTRSQWFNLSGSYLTFYNSADAFIKPINGGIALSYSRDDQAKGTLVTDRIDFTYAQHFSLINEKLKIIPSIQFSCFRKTLDNSKLNYGDQIDPRRGFVWSQAPVSTGKVSKINGDLSAGLIVNYNHFYFGSSVFHITQPDEGIRGPSKLPFRFSAFTSYNLFLGEKVLINGLLRFEQQQFFRAINFNISALFAKHLMVSTGSLNRNTINSFIGYRHNYFTISGGYEFGIRSINSSAGSYEICASFNLRSKDERHALKDLERW